MFYDLGRTGRIFARLAVLVALVLPDGCSPETAEKADQSVESTSVLQPELQLPEAETARLWELEHRANVLGEYGFRRLKSALTDNDPAALLALLTSDFHGTFADSGDSVELQGETVRAHRVLNGGQSSAEQLAAKDFVERLLELREPIDSVFGCNIGVKRIGPVDRDDPAGPWETTAQLWLRGDSEGSRIETTAIFRLRTPQPKKAHLAENPWIRQWTILETSFARSDRAAFRDVTAEAGLDVTRLHDNWDSQKKINNLGGVYVCDFNQDHVADVLVTDVNPTGNTLYVGQPDGTFRDVTNLIGVGRIRQVSLAMGNAAFVDLNNDGWVDLLHTEGGIWENRGGTEFIERTNDSNLFEVLDRRNVEVKAVGVADYDRDGLLDLYALRRNEMPTSWLESTGKGPGNVLCRNLGNWQFEDVTEQTNTGGHQHLIFTTVWLDYDNDSWPDIAVINEFGDSFLYRNVHGKRFEKVDPDPNKSDFGSMGVDVGDVNNDGLIDLYIAGMYSKAGSRVIGNLDPKAFPQSVMDRLHSLIDGSELYLNQDGQSFAAAGYANRVHDVGWSWGPTLADFNNDGWLDIYAPSGYMSRDRNRPDG